MFEFGYSFLIFLLDILLSWFADDTDGLAVEQVRRRAREWSIRILKTHREALIREENEELERLRQEEAERRRIEEENASNRLINEAMALDADWVAQEKRTQDVRNKTKFDMAELQWMPRFDMNNPAKPDREHQHSWKLKSFGGQNGDLPIEPQAVIQVSYWRMLSATLLEVT